MVSRNFTRLPAVILALILLAVPVFASSSQQLAAERQVYEYLTTELKLTTAAACGVLANIEQESSFQPTVFGDQGTSFGLCQWHNDRFSALRGYCSALGLDYRTVEGQLAYLRYELGTRYTSLLLTLQSLDNTPDSAYRAAYLWCIQFEKPSNAQVKAVQRGELARGKYWARYQNTQSVILAEPQPEETLPDPEELVGQLVQHSVTIPLPPQEEEPEQTGTVRYFRFKKPDFIYFVPRNLPSVPREQDIPWELPALACIGAAMVVVIIFPTKKRPASLYRRGLNMVE